MNASELLWIPQERRTPDVHAAFRGMFEVKRETNVEIRALGASWFVLWLDGDYLLEGPPRFIAKFPEYDHRTLTLPPGKHVLAAQVHDEGLATRMMPDVPPFLWMKLMAHQKEVPMRWKCRALAGYRSQFRRINPQLGWVEWCDTRSDPADWRYMRFDDAAWSDPVPTAAALGELMPRSIGPVQRFDRALSPIASGPLAEAFGYEADDPPARFFLRDLECRELPPAGVWRRYDLGRVRLGRPRFELDVPAGAVIEFASAEQLRHGRVSPYITLSGGPSCNLDHFVARGGVQEFFPLTPKGGRFLEIHVAAAESQVKFIKQAFVERAYHGEPEGSFHSNDDLLNRIWSTGVETYRACAEDAIIDNPTRERGQWLGDAIIGGETASVAYSDLRLMRRGLLQTARCAREDGLVPGMTTGGLIFLASYALLWVPGCTRYFQLTGDGAFLEELFEPARRNLAAFEPHVHPDGLHDSVADTFIDWGFDRAGTPINIPLNLHYLSALRAMSDWCRILKRDDHVDHYTRRHELIRSILRKLIDGYVAKQNWDGLGYHAAALALAHNFFKGDAEGACINFLKRHMLSCFPNNPDAPRNSHPGVTCRQLITPYFAHFVMPPLIERGEMDFVLDQYRKCWGWALGHGRTTWLEVFDTRWSHCHQWSGCPTWQLSRYVLGLYPRFDLGERHFDFRVLAGSLKNVEGKLPLPNEGGVIQVRWSRDDCGLHYELRTPRPIVLHTPDRIVNVENGFEATL